MVGATHVTLPSFQPLAMLETLERERINITVLVPAMIQALADHPEAKSFDLSSLRRLAYGGSPISEAVLERATALLPNAEFSQVYGMTELAPTATCLGAAMHTPQGRARGKLRSGGQAALGVAGAGARCPGLRPALRRSG